MNIFYTSGTLGDAYVILCKLYREAQKEQILVNHYTSLDELRPTIKEIYSLCPNIVVEFRDYSTPSLDIVGQYFHHEPESERKRQAIEDGGYNLKPEHNPKFDLGSIERFALPQQYETLQLENGVKSDKMRRLDQDMIERISRRSKLPLVIVGTDSVEYYQMRHLVIDLRGKTNIKEVINVIKNGVRFYGCLGLLSLAALSQKVPSTLFLPRGYRDKRAFRSRIVPVAEWMRHVER